jgi:hypothetical protein
VEEEITYHDIVIISRHGNLPPFRTRKYWELQMDLEGPVT